MEEKRGVIDEHTPDEQLRDEPPAKQGEARDPKSDALTRIADAQKRSAPKQG